MEFMTLGLGADNILSFEPYLSEDEPQLIKTATTVQSGF